MITSTEKHEQYLNFLTMTLSREEMEILNKAMGREVSETRMYRSESEFEKVFQLYKDISDAFNNLG